MNSLHANFNGGEETPLMNGRFDTDKLNSSCRVLKNFTVRPYGAVFKRPGTKFVGSVKNAADSTRAIHFKRSTSTNYVLEVGDYYMRFWKGGSTPAQVQVSGVPAWVTATVYAVGALVSSGGVNYYCKLAHTSGVSFSGAGTNWYALTGTIFEIPTPWAKADVFGLQFTQINDVMFFAHPNYLPYRLSRYAETNVVLELVPFTFAPTLDVNTSRVAVQVQYNVPPYNPASTGVTVGTRVLGITAPWINEVFTCVTAYNPSITGNSEPGVGAIYKTYWALGTSSVLAADWATATSYTAGALKRDNKVVYQCTVSHTSSASTEPGVGSGWATVWKISTGDYDNGNLTYNLVSTEAVFASTDVGTTWQVQIGSAAYYRTFILNTTPQVSKGLFIQGDMLITTNWIINNVAAGTYYLEQSEDMATWNRIKQWNITAYDGNISSTVTATESGSYYRIGAIIGTTQGFSIKLEPVSNVLTVPFVITGYTSSTLVTGYVVMPGNARLPLEAVGVSTTLYRKPAFSATGGYPRTVAFHSSRLWFAGTAGNPGRLWASETDNYYTFLNGTLATSAIDETLAAEESNEIRWMKSHGRYLILGTTGEEWTIDSGDAGAVLTPTNIRALRRTNKGSCGIPAELVGDSLLLAGYGARRIFEFTYQFAGDKFVSPDLTVLAEHVTQGGLVQVAFQSSPDPILWCVMGNGTLAGFTYMRDQQVTAWHRHTTGDDAGDAFESVAVIYGADVSDEVWFVVRRTIGGVTVRNMERFDPTVFRWNTEQGGVMDGHTWLDCAVPGVLASTVTNSGANCGITGFTALNGRSVRMLAGLASPASSAVVTAGAATFSAYNATAGTNPIVGLPIISQVQPMPLDMMLQDGTAQGHHWEPRRVQFLLNQCLGGQFTDDPASTFDALEYPAGTVTPFTGRIRQHIPGAGGGVSETTFAIRHADPYPFAMLGYILTAEVER
jgi:hypothetical protein